MKNNLVSIVIPTHNRKEMLLRLIKSLLNSDYKFIEIIIVDDASTDGTAVLIKEKFAKYKNIILTSNKKNLYTAGSRNKGANLSKGRYIFFIDDDNVVTDTLISNLVTVMDNNDHIGEVGPVMYYYSEKNKLFWAGTKRNMVTSKTNFTTSFGLHNTDRVWETDDVLNAFMVRSSVIKENGISFIENLGIMYEESDYAWKIRKAGYSIVVVKNAIIYHDVEQVSGEPGAFLQHTLLDKKRVYFTARNRLIFHSRYSSASQLIGILFFWQWLFSIFYSVNIIRYRGKENYTFIQKLNFIFLYFHGIYDGILIILTKKNIK